MPERLATRPRSNSVLPPGEAAHLRPASAGGFPRPSAGTRVFHARASPRGCSARSVRLAWELVTAPEPAPLGRAGMEPDFQRPVCMTSAGEAPANLVAQNAEYQIAGRLLAVRQAAIAVRRISRCQQGSGSEAQQNRATQDLQASILDLQEFYL